MNNRSLLLSFQGTARRKKKVVHRTATTDDKKLQSSLKKLAVNNIPGIEEVRYSSLEYFDLWYYNWTSCFCLGIIYIEPYSVQIFCCHYHLYYFVCCWWKHLQIKIIWIYHYVLAVFAGWMSKCKVWVWQETKGINVITVTIEVCICIYTTHKMLGASIKNGWSFQLHTNSVLVFTEKIAMNSCWIVHVCCWVSIPFSWDSLTVCRVMKRNCKMSKKCFNLNTLHVQQLSLCAKFTFVAL